MKLSVIVAKSKNNVIGVNNTLPWKLSDDLKNFKRITLGHPIIMGRKTYDSIGKPLPKRENIVITRQEGLEIKGCRVYNTFEEAIVVAQHLDEDEAFIIGGAEIINRSISFVDKMYITEVHAEVVGDTFLREIDYSEWDEIGRTEFKKSHINEYDFTVIEYLRK